MGHLRADSDAFGALKLTETARGVLKGETEVWLHIDNGVEMMQLRVSHAYWVDASPDFCDQVVHELGEGRVLVPQPV